MPAVKLDLISEPFSPSGNVAADGVRKLLGAPRLNLLQTLVREAVQNSCDAAKLGAGPKVIFRLRQLEPSQMETLAHDLLCDLPGHDETSGPVRNFLAGEAPWVLEICDFGTSGLGGPTRADIPPKEGEQTDFVDFIRNIGSKRNTELGGGTYGYGKSALYLASKCSLIVVDSETRCAGEPVRRLIAAQLGEAHDSEANGTRRRFTGRHWWGRLDESGTFVDPLEGEDAADLADRLGFPKRGADARGTSIMILDPDFGAAEDTAKVVGAIQESLLWYFWPRMMADVGDERRLEVCVELDGVDQLVPKPENTPPLDLFCQAMRAIRRNGSSVLPVICSRPDTRVGSLCVEKGHRAERIPFGTGSDTLFPRTSHHIAVMRPVELVVRYFDSGDPLPQEEFEWAGVFVTSRDTDVERAFADAEPPAHDDWQPEMLPERSRGRRWVRRALESIRETARGVSGGQATATSGHREGPSLAHVADIFGRALGSTNGQGAGVTRDGGGGGGGGSRSSAGISRPTFDRLEEVDGNPAAWFVADIRNEVKAELELLLEPSLVIDGGSAANEAAGYMVPPVLAVLDADGNLMGDGVRLVIGIYAGRVQLLIQLPSDGAVMVKASVEAVS
jgi:hypothetical protein